MQTMTENILDVTLLKPGEKHPEIFKRFDALVEGDHVTIFNDHDPKPLYYQLLGERGNVFKWEYLEQGPEWWKVRITKRMKNDIDETLGQIAAKDVRKAQIFKKYGLDFCCGGKKTVKEACSEKGLDVAKVEHELQQSDQLTYSRPIPFGDWSIDFLADYIVNTHHSYVRKMLPDLLAYSEKVMKAHGSKHPELIQITQLIFEVNDELTAHMIKEEKVLFPYIKELVKAGSNGSSWHAMQLGTIQNPINMMEMEHELVGSNLAALRELSNNYSLPEDACASYRLLYKMLDEFEEDLHLHIHLENNILFPKALELERLSAN